MWESGISRCGQHEPVSDQSGGPIKDDMASSNNGRMALLSGSMGRYKRDMCSLFNLSIFPRLVSPFFPSRFPRFSLFSLRSPLLNYTVTFFLSTNLLPDLASDVCFYLFGPGSFALYYCQNN